MEHVIVLIMVDACGQVGPKSYLILCLYIILIVFIFTLRITPIWPVVTVLMGHTHLVPGSVLNTSHAQMHANLTAANGFFCCPFFIDEETEA